MASSTCLLKSQRIFIANKRFELVSPKPPSYCQRVSTENAHRPQYSLLFRWAPSMPQLVRKYCKLFAGVRKQVCKALQGSPCSHFSLFPEGCLRGRRGVSELGNLGSLAFFSRCPRQSTPFCTWCRVVSLQWHLHGLMRTVWNSVPR